MKPAILIAAMLLSAPAAAQTPPAPPPAAAQHYRTAETTLGTMLDDPAAKAVLVKYLPEMVQSEQIDMARGMTLKQIQPYAPTAVTDKVLGEIDGELAKLPATQP